MQYFYYLYKGLLYIQENQTIHLSAYWPINLMKNSITQLKTINYSHFSSQQLNSITSFNSLLPKSQVTIHEVVSEQKPKREIGQYYRIDKTFQYKEKIMALYLMSVMLSGAQSERSITYCKAIQGICMSSIRQFQQQLIAESRRLQQHEQQQFLQTLKTKDKLINLVENLTLSNDLSTEQLEVLVDVVVGRWVKAEVDDLSEDVLKVYGQELVVSEQLPAKMITKLLIVDDSSDLHQKHLLYKKLVMSISSSQIAEIIETNRQKHVYFCLTFPQINPTSKASVRSRISELFHQKDRTQVVQSEGENTESDSKSQIVKDEEFYRISSKIDTSIRKNSFNSCETIADHRYLMLANDRSLLSANDLHAKGEKCLQFRSWLYNSVNPGQTSEHKINNPVSEMYTRSSSLEKSNFLLRENLSTSIDLLMRLQLQNQHMRKKSCENSRTYHKSIQKSSHNIQTTPKQRPDQKIKINLFGQDRFCDKKIGEMDVKMDVKMERDKVGLGSNKRLLVVRSFFRQNANVQKD